MKCIIPVPIGLDELNEVYGNPDANGDFLEDAGFAKEHLTVVELPYPMKLSWRPATIIQRVRCHVDVAESLIDALEEILETVGLEQLQLREWDRWGGCYEFRKMRGYNALSVHSWGCAVDICPDLGRFGNRDDIETYPAVIRDAFIDRNWDWGGGWPAKYSADAQHFQAVKNY